MCEGSEVARREKWESSEVTCGRFLVIFNGGGHRVAPRFHLFVSDVDQWNEGAGRVQDHLAWSERWKDSP